MIKLGDESILNCPKCGKEYNMEEYDKLDKTETQTYEQSIISVHGKAAPKEALMEIAKRIGINKVNATGGKLYEQHIDIFNREKDKTYDARICSKCSTEFGFVEIINKTDKGTIFHLDLDLLIHKEQK